MKRAKPANGAAAEKSECFCMGTGPQITQMVRNLGPDSAWGHFRNARIEVLKGVREVIDNRIAQLSKQKEKGARVTVE